MKCPVCQETLLMMDRQGIEVDYCPRCRGVWLDRGELEKLIEQGLKGKDHGSQQRRPEREYENDDDDDHRRTESGHPPKYRKRSSWLGEIFDFD